MTRFGRLIGAADRLRRLPPAGSATADAFLHDLLGRAGPVPPYTSDEAVRLLLPPGFDADFPTTGAGEVYAAVWRRGLLDGRPHPHHGQWGRTRALALCGAVLRAHAKLEKGRG